MPDDEYNDAVEDLAETLSDLSDTNEQVRRQALNSWAVANGLIDQSEDFIDEYRNAGISGFNEAEQFVEGEDIAQQQLYDFLETMEGHDSGRRRYLGQVKAALVGSAVTGLLGAAADISGLVKGDNGYDIDIFGALESSGANDSGQVGVQQSNQANSQINFGPRSDFTIDEGVALFEYVERRTTYEGLPFDLDDLGVYSDGEGFDFTYIEAKLEDGNPTDDSVVGYGVEDENGNQETYESGGVDDGAVEIALNYANHGDKSVREYTAWMEDQ